MLTWLVASVCVAANVAAVAAVLVGWRSAAPRRYAMGCVALGVLTWVVGLGGTVLGLQRAFGAVGSVDASHKSALLAQGISEAMNATAFGIAACVVPFGVAVALFFRRARPPTPPPDAAPP